MSCDVGEATERLENEQFKIFNSLLAHEIKMTERISMKFCVIMQ